MGEQMEQLALTPAVCVPGAQTFRPFPSVPLCSFFDDPSVLHHDDAVEVFAGVAPMLGMLMLPKTVCCLVLVFTFYNAVVKDDPRGVC